MPTTTWATPRFCIVAEAAMSPRLLLQVPAVREQQPAPKHRDLPHTPSFVRAEVSAQSQSATEQLTTMSAERPDQDEDCGGSPERSKYRITPRSFA